VVELITFIRFCTVITVSLFYIISSVSAGSVSHVNVIMPAGNTVELPLHSIGKHDYVLLSDLATKIFAGSVYDANKKEIRFNNNRLRFAPTSFYIIRNLPTGAENTAQMPLPTLTRQKEMFAPIPYVFTALESVKIFSVDLKNGIHLRTYFEKNNTESKINKPILSDKSTLSIQEKGNKKDITTLNTVKKQSESTKSDDAENPKSDNTVKPGIYRLPTDLEKPTREQLLYADAGQFAESIQPKKIPPTVKSVVFTVTDSGYICIVHADRPIPAFQKPEIVQGNMVKLRIPNALLNMKNNSIQYPKGIEGVHTDIIRDIVVISVKTENTIENASSQREGANSVRMIMKMEEKKNPEKNKEKGKQKIIILDPGHGGEDVGAIGISGSYEKNITLAVAKKAKKYIEERLPDTKVILTRDKDLFLGLKQRTEFANKNKGILFVSIHCNAAPSKPHPANGFEVYVLRPGKTKDAIRVAERENAVAALEKNSDAIKKMTEEQLIVATMAQSAFVKMSDKFAAILKNSVHKKTDLADRGIAQAGFYVLVGASMPNVLAELAFITNEKDEKYLRSEEGQNELALALAESVKEFTGDTP